MTEETNTELLARYVEGNVTAEERTEVREFLATHPEEMESVLCMMDDDYDLIPEDEDDNIGSMGHVDNIGIMGHVDEVNLCYSAAAFAPMSGVVSGSVNQFSGSSIDVQKITLADRLDDLLSEF